MKYGQRERTTQAKGTKERTGTHLGWICRGCNGSNAFYSPPPSTLYCDGSDCPLACVVENGPRWVQMPPVNKVGRRSDACPRQNFSNNGIFHLAEDNDQSSTRFFR